MIFLETLGWGDWTAWGECQKNNVTKELWQEKTRKCDREKFDPKGDCKGPSKDHRIVDRPDCKQMCPDIAICD